MSAPRQVLAPLLPPRGAVRPLGALRPRGPSHAASVIGLWLLFLAYLVVWVRGNAAMLFDLSLQTDDARMWLFPFHRYGPEGALADDPISLEYLAQIPPGVRLLYAILVPRVGLFAAAKGVQLLALAVVGAAGWTLAWSKRGGLGAALLLVFLVLHTPFVINLGAGGLARNFGFPIAALWVAGAVAARDRVRWAAALLGALTYPPVMLLVLGAEGLLAVRGLGEISRRRLGRRLGRYAILVVLCGAVLVPYLHGRQVAGPPPTLAEARADRAFGPKGRIAVLPFADPMVELLEHLTLPYRSWKPSDDPGPVRVRYAELGSTGPVLWLLLLGGLGLANLSPAPRSALALGGASVVLYALARVLAFRLFDPTRYYLVGMPVVAIALAVEGIGLLAPRLAPVTRATLRNATAAAVGLALCLLTGDGVVPRNGMTIHTGDDAELHAFVATLPVRSRIATHLLDGQSIPLVAARATTGNYETVMPWATATWERARSRTEDTLTALYAGDRQVVLDYGERYGITHLLLHDERYGPDARRLILRSASVSGRPSEAIARTEALFEPFRRVARALARATPWSDLVLRSPPPEAVVYGSPPWTVVEMKALRRAWGVNPSPGAEPDEVGDRVIAP